MKVDQRRGGRAQNSTGVKRQSWTTAQNTSSPCPSLCHVNNAFKVDSREKSLSAGSQEETQLALDGTYEKTLMKGLRTEV